MRLIVILPFLHSNHYLYDYLPQYNNIFTVKYKNNIVRANIQRLIQCGGQDCPLADLSKVTLLQNKFLKLRNTKKYPPIYKTSIKNSDINQPTKIDPDLADMDTSCYTSPGDFKMFLFFHSH